MEKITPAVKTAGMDLLIVFAHICLAVFALVVGLYISRAVNTYIKKVLNKIDFDNRASKIGINEMCVRFGFGKSPTYVIAFVLSWVVMIVAIIYAAKALNLNEVQVLLSRFLAFLPTIFISLFILFAGLVFGKFIGKIIENSSKANNLPGGVAVARAVETPRPGELAKWLASRCADLTAVLPQGRWAGGSGEIDALWLAGSAVARVGVAGLNPADEKALVAWLEDPARPKAMHAAKGPLEAFADHGWHLAGLVMDTELAAYLLAPDQRSFALEALTEQYLGRPIASGQGDTLQATLDFGDTGDDGAADRVVAILDLAEVLAASLRSDGQAGLLADLELPVQRVLAGMERVGVAADAAVWQRLRDDLDDAVITAEKAAFGIVGHEFNLSSPKQLQAILFDDLKMPKTKKTKVGYTTDAAALEALYATTEHPFLAQLLAHRDNIKLRQIVDALMRAIADDRRIHTTYIQTAAATGRLSSADPNLQNIPIRSDTGRRVREGFVAGSGYELLLSADYSQIEMCVMAHVSGDPALSEAYRSGVDCHTVTTARD